MAGRLALVLLASLLQFHGLTRDSRLRADEAFFLTFARDAAVQGDWMLPGPLDKPPLSIYASGLSLAFVAVTADEAGALHLDALVGEFGGRLPNALLAIVLTALMARLAWRLTASERSAAIAALLTATSPYLLAYGASAFTDMSLLFWATAAVYAAIRGRAGCAGLALGLAVWSKQQALFALPLVVLLLARQPLRRTCWARFVMTLALACFALLLWDMARPEPSLFLQAARNNAPSLWIAPPGDWIGRLTTWLGGSLWLLGPPPVTLGLLALTVWRWRSARRCRSSLPIFALAIGAYVLPHTVFNFNLYSRYLLLIAPLLILMVARECRALGRLWRTFALTAILAGAVWTLSMPSALPDAQDRRKGIEDLAAHLNAKPVATVIYDPWLGWELGYYLGPWHDKRRVHYPTAEALAAGALALDEHGDRLFVAPIEQPHEAWLAALEEAGFGLAPDYERDGFLVYRLSPESQTLKH